VESRTHVQLPPHIEPPYEVFVNGVPQVEGDDYDVFGSTLVFERPLTREGKLSRWLWIRMFLGIAGTYRKNDSIDVIYTLNGIRTVSNVKPSPPPTFEFE
jgi:hypothetical protein